MSSLLREMYMSDLANVLDIIEAHDDDDAEAAEDEFADNGVEGHFVAEQNDQVIGVTGAREVEGCQQTYWLSWTYLSEAYRGQGLGKQMLNELIVMLREREARKVFIKVSDYVDDDGTPIYAAALALYQSLGFKQELKSEDFYDEGENQIILSLNLLESAEQQAVDIADEKPNICFDGLYEIAETDGAYSFHWTVKKKLSLFGKTGFSTEDLLIGLRAVKEQGGRKVFLTFPSNLVLIHIPLQVTGFELIGQLDDYYEVGLHELHFSHDLSKLN